MAPALGAAIQLSISTTVMSANGAFTVGSDSSELTIY